MTKTEQLVEGLKALNYKEVESKSRKYRTFKGDNLPYCFFVGKAGALRMGKSSSKSRSLTGGRFYGQVMAAGAKIGRCNN